MGYQGGCILLEITRDYALSAHCVFLEFIEFRECFGVIS